MTFRLTTLMYLFALVAASLAAFGPVGVVAVVGVPVFWAGWFYLPKLTRPAWTLWSVLLRFLALSLLLPVLQSPREAGPRNSCLNNSKQLMLAIQNYHDACGELPLVFGKASGQKAAQSWRVHILKTLEGNMVHRIYNFDEPWDGPTNRKRTAAVSIDTHECIEHGIAAEASYFAVTGPQTVWGDGEPRTFDDVTDKLGDTIMLIEAAGRGVHWSEPKDLTLDEAVELLTTPLPDDNSDGHRVDLGYFHKPYYTRLVAYCDGHARALPVPIKREAAIALLTANGGETIDPEWLERHSGAQLDHGRVWGFSLFVVLALLPGVPKLRPFIWPQLVDNSALQE